MNIKSGKEYFLPFCRLILQNGFEVAMRGFPYACGHGICKYAPFYDVIEFDTDISHYPTWNPGGKDITMWLITPADSGFPPGWWYYVEDKEMHIGIRQKQFGAKKSIYYKYGWIKVNAVSHQNTSYVSFAIEK